MIDLKNEYNHLPHLTFLLEIFKVYALRRKKLDRRVTDVRNEITVVFHRSLSDTEQSSWNLRRLYELQQQYKQRTWTYCGKLIICFFLKDVLLTKTMEHQRDYIGFYNIENEHACYWLIMFIPYVYKMCQLSKAIFVYCKFPR